MPWEVSHLQSSEEKQFSIPQWGLPAVSIEWDSLKAFNSASSDAHIYFEYVCHADILLYIHFFCCLGDWFLIYLS